MSDPAPVRIGPYEPRKQISGGSQSRIWLADGPDGPVALKLASSTAQRPNLLKEAKILEAMPHPGMANLVGRSDDGSWIALEFIAGQSIDTWAASRSYSEIAGAVSGVLATVAHLSANRVVHGDIKPSNVLIDEHGKARLLDLGIATMDDDTVRGFKGTLGYAAPELLRGGRPTERTDIYAVGALLYRCLTGRPPFVAPDPAALTYLPLVSLPPPPSSFDVHIPRVLDKLVLSLLTRDPARRPSDPARVAPLVERAASGQAAHPILGMVSARDDLRRAVVGAADGEGRVVVVYGPPGSGRRALITEAIEAARREGLEYRKPNEIGEAMAAMRDRVSAPVLVLRASQRASLQLARAILEEGLPGLVFLHHDRPIPELGKPAIQLTPPPLGLRDVERLAQFYGADASSADTWWREAIGLPGVVMACIHAHLRRRDGAPPDPRSLAPEARRVLAAVDQLGEVEVPDLAQRLQLGEHALLDWCEPLFAGGFLEPTREGLAVRRLR